MKMVSVVMTLITCICLALVALACGDEEGGTPNPGGRPTGTITRSATPQAEAPGITDSEIVLGADAPLSGAYGAVYSMVPRATEAYFNYVNDTQGGVCGRKIVYKVEDNNFDPARAAEAVRKLVERDEVFAIVGSLGDLPHSGVWDYLNENGIPDLLVSGGAHRYGADPEGHPFTFQMLPSYMIGATFIGQYISEDLPGKKVGYLGEMNGHDEALAGLRNGLDPTKNELVSEQSYEPTAVDIRSQIINLENAGAEVVFLATSPGFLAQAIKQADRMGWHPQFFTGYVSSDETIFQFVPPELLEGIITSQAYKLAAWTDDPAVAAHRDIMQKYGGPIPTNFSIYAQSLAELAVEILSRTCADLTREGLLESTKSIKDWHSDLLLDNVTISLSETDHTAIQTGRMLKVSLVDGKGKFEYFGPLFVFEDEQLQ
jgi:branched-chain amino acid transport system substrate-binding protein